MEKRPYLAGIFIVKWAFRLKFLRDLLRADKPSFFLIHFRKRGPWS